MSDYKPIEARCMAHKPFSKKDVCQHHAEYAGQEAHFALELTGRWGMVAAVDDGEDSAGRSTVRLATPDELVARAIETTEKLFAECRTRGWFFPAPMPLAAVDEDGDPVLSWTEAGER